MIDQVTYEFYQSGAPFFTSSGAQAQSRHLDAFLARLQPKAEILELGCGTGRDGAYMTAHGFRVDATDGIPAMVAKANERHGIGARLMRFDELDAQSAYDAVWAHACLLHCPRSALPGVLARIRAALRPNCWHYASYKLGTGEGRDLLGRLHNFPSVEWLIEAYETADLLIEDTTLFAAKSSDGTMPDWLAVTVRKP